MFSLFHILDLSLNPHPQNLSSPQPSTEVLHERYSRDKLIELMDKKLSIVAPILKRSVHKLLSNSSSSNLLVNTLTRDETLPQDTNLLRKSSTMTTFDSSIRNEIFLVKSFSLDLAKHDKAGDGWIQTKDGAEALKMFRSCLNKLTVDNFDVILAEVKMMRVSDDETILSFIKLLYEKAIIEPTYANHYVQLTMALKNIFTIGPGKKTFDYFAIVACQTGFEEAMQKLMNVKTMSEDDKDKLRRGLSGSIQFIAKMYLNRILNSRIITEICEELLKLECVESIEPLCKLLEISGAEIESAQLNNDKMNKIMKKLSNLAKIFPTRNKFMIQNLIEQRQNGWKPRFSKDGPKKLDQVAIECGFVKRLGVVGRYDELQSNFEEEYRPMTRNDNFNRNDRGNHGNHSRSFRGQRNRHGKPFRAL